MLLANKNNNKSSRIRKQKKNNNKPYKKHMNLKVEIGKSGLLLKAVGARRRWRCRFIIVASTVHSFYP